jgi:hypothetical protein
MSINKETGYGQLSGETVSSKKALISVHRFSYEIFVGAIDRGMNVCHSCDIRACFNPKHLFQGTQRDNMIDCSKKGRANKPRGEHHRSAVLSESQVALIRSSHDNPGALARRFGVRRQTIDAILSFKSWRHVGPRQLGTGEAQ